MQDDLNKNGNLIIKKDGFYTTWLIFISLIHENHFFTPANLFVYFVKIIIYW